MFPTEPKNLGALYLIPNLLGEAFIDSSLPSLIAAVVARLSCFIVEDEKSARRLIKQLSPGTDLRALSMQRLNKHTQESELALLTQPLLAGIDIGIISEAGCPAIADPGAEIVRLAHTHGVRVHPLVGPCSMTLALMASGFNGQRWRFAGYLPMEAPQRKETLLGLERDLYNNGETQIVMDTPYRNQRLLEDILTHCRADTMLCVAAALTTSTELIQVHSVAEWRRRAATIGKTPALFLLGT